MVSTVLLAWDYIFLCVLQLLGVRLEEDMYSQGIFRWKNNWMLVSMFLPQREKGTANIRRWSKKEIEFCVCAPLCLCVYSWSDFSTYQKNTLDQWQAVSFRW